MKLYLTTACFPSTALSDPFMLCIQGKNCRIWRLLLIFGAQQFAKGS